MGYMKWTAKGLRVTSPILAIADMEVWLRYHGRALFQTTADRLWVGWFFPRRRSRRKIIRNLSKTVNSSKPLHLALRISLGKLPSLIGYASARIEKAGPRTLGVANNAGWLVIVPRALVRKVYERALIRDLAQSAELARFDGLSTVFLTRKVLQSEELFFQMVKKHGYYVSSSTGMIFGVDASFDWRWGGVAGHYYYGECTRLDKLLTNRRDRKGFQANMEKGLRRKKEEIGVLDSQKIQQIVNSLRT